MGPKPPLLSRHRVTAGLVVGLRAWVLPTDKSPPLSPSREKTLFVKEGVEINDTEVTEEVVVKVARGL